MVVVIVSFIVVFVLILFAVSLGMKFVDSRRKTQMVGMLQTASGEQAVTLTNLLKEIEPDKPTGLSQIVSSLHFSKHAQEQIAQAGLTWSSNRLLVMMGVMAVAGLLKEKPRPTDADIDATITNICRCGTYQRVRAGIHSAASKV